MGASEGAGCPPLILALPITMGARALFTVEIKMDGPLDETLISSRMIVAMTMGALLDCQAHLPFR